MYFKTELEDYVETLYQELGIHYIDGLTMEHVADRLNISIYHYGYHTQAMRVGGRMIINLNASIDSYEDQWQNFGHELFHILKDEGNQSLIPVPLRELRECKARNFAMHFCIPTFMLQQLSWPSESAAPFIAEQFCVTIPFATRRIEGYQNRVLQSRIDDQRSELLSPADRTYDSIDTMLKKRGLFSANRLLRMHW